MTLPSHHEQDRLPQPELKSGIHQSRDPNIADTQKEERVTTEPTPEKDGIDGCYDRIGRVARWPETKGADLSDPGVG